MEKKVINQKEYLKKYLSSGDVDEKKKKKKKKSKFGSQKVKIIDDDIDLKNLRPIQENEFDIFINSEDAPQIVGVVDDRGPVDFTDKKKWRIMADDIDGELQITHNKSSKKDVTDKKISKDEDNDLSPVRKSSVKVHKNRTVTNSDSESNSDSNLNVHKKRKVQRRKRWDHTHDSDIDEAKRQESTHQDAHSLPVKKSYDSDSDLSPPRRKTIRSQSNSDSDVSVPRSTGHSQCRNHKRDISPSIKNDHNRNINTFGDDRSKTKSQKYQMSDNLNLNSPRRHDKKRKKDGDSSHSPLRRKEYRSKNENDTDLSYRKKKSHQYQRDSDSDLSPPRRSSKKQRYSDVNSDSGDERKILKDSYKRRKEKYESWSDQDKSNNKNDSGLVRQSKYSDFDTNSVRKHKRYYNDDSPKRERENTHTKYKQAYDNDVQKSLSRHRQHHKDRKFQKDGRGRKHSEKIEQNTSSDSDLSPARKRCRDTDRNASPPLVSEDSHTDNVIRERERQKNDDRKIARHRTDHKRSEKSSSHRSGYGTDSPKCSERKMKKTLDGKTAGLQDAKALKEETEAHKRREAEQFNKFSKEISGKGKAAIVRDTKTGRKRDLEAEAAEEREKEKRQQELNEKYMKWGRGLKQVEDHAERLKDDMYEMSKPLARYADDVDLDRKLREQEREGDPMLDYIKQKQVKEGKRKPDRPEYQGSYMPNRFGIKPGHRWDGVDRSNGYEKKWFEARNARVALQEDAYKWSTADM